MSLTFGFPVPSFKICALNTKRADLELLRHKSDSQTEEKNIWSLMAVTIATCHFVRIESTEKVTRNQGMGLTQGTSACTEKYN